MIKKSRLFLPFALLGLVLTGCGNASELQDNFTDADKDIPTQWTEMPATGIQFAEGEENLVLKQGESHEYKFSILPKGATGGGVNWFSNDTNVATVDKGVVTAVGGGDAIITASSPENVFDPVELNVEVVVPITDFSLDVPERIDWDAEYQFAVTYQPADTTERQLSYEITEASVEGLVSVNEQGVVTTTNKNGTAKLKVSGGEDGKISHTYTLNISTIPVTSVVISGAGDAHDVEINHALQLSATVTPNDATEYTRRGVKFYSDHPEIAAVDEMTGVVTGVSEGSANIHAHCGIDSANYVINVFRVKATSVAITTGDFALSNENDNGLTKQLEYSMGLYPSGYEKPSQAEISFVSDHPEVATVSDTGLVTAVGPGTAEISVKVAQQGLELLHDEVNVTVTIVSKQLTITGGNSFYNDSTLTLSASLVPANVSNDEITWSVAPEGVVTLSATTGSNVTLIPVDNEATGKVTVTATNTDGASNTLEVQLLERVVEFESGRHYIVGSGLYNTGISTGTVEGKSSWTTAKYAFKFTEKNDSAYAKEEYKATIKFMAGDEFKYFIGTNYEVPTFEEGIGDDSLPWKSYHIEQDGAFLASGGMHLKDTTNESRVVVDDTAWYDLYSKQYGRENQTDWYQLYIVKSAITVDVDDITIGNGRNFQINAHSMRAMSYEVTSGQEYATVSPTGLITTAASGDGTAVITISDNRGLTATVTVHVDHTAGDVNRTVYLNANKMFDADNAVPYVHSWGGTSDAFDGKMEKVAGQTLIYTASIPLDHTMIDFVRCPSDYSEEAVNWESIWNQSKDQPIPTDGKDMFTMTGWSEDKDSSSRTYIEGSWSTYDPGTIYGEAKVVTLYYCDSLEWEGEVNKMSAYAWKEGVGSSENAAWPGEQMTYVGLDKDDQKVYSYELDLADYDHIIFACGTNQTVDIDISSAVNHQGYKPTTASAGKYGVENYAYIPKSVAPTTYTVSFNANTGSGTMADVPDQSGNYTLPANGFIAPEGQYFVGWKANNAGDMLDPGDTYEVTENVTFYAQWADIPAGTFTVSFNANGGTGTMADVPDQSGNYTLPANGFTRDGYNFVGWKANNEGATLNAGDTYALTADVTFYAQWELIPSPENITIYFSNNHSWANVYCYAFEQDVENSYKVAWPGEQMTYVGVNDNNEDYYSFTLDKNTYDTVIFCNGVDGNSNQTVNISIASATTGSAYYIGETQVAEGDDAGKWNVGTWTYTEGMFNSIRVLYMNRPDGWGDLYVHMFKEEPAATTTWPGMHGKFMRNNEFGEAVYRFVFDTSKYDTIIFNDGGSNQLENFVNPLATLNGSENAFYYNGSFHGYEFNPAA